MREEQSKNMTDLEIAFIKRALLFATSQPRIAKLMGRSTGAVSGIARNITRKSQEVRPMAYREFCKVCLAPDVQKALREMDL